MFSCGWKPFACCPVPRLLPPSPTAPSLHILSIPTHLSPGPPTPNPRIQPQPPSPRPQGWGPLGAQNNFCSQKALRSPPNKEPLSPGAPPRAGLGRQWARPRRRRPRPGAGPGCSAALRGSGAAKLAISARRWLLLRLSGAAGTWEAAVGLFLCPAPGVRDGRCTPGSIVSVSSGQVPAALSGRTCPSGGRRSGTRWRRQGRPRARGGG